MLVALAADESYVTLTHHLCRASLQQLRQAQSFYCPQCKEPLILKIGQVKIPHFAHQKNTNCDLLFSEGESRAHLLGKQQLLLLFQRLQLDVKLEPYLQHLRQRPDLLVIKNNTHYAIEFQCSRLVTERFMERTIGYRQQKIVPIWILNTPTEKHKQQGLFKISLNHFQRLFLSRKGQPFLMTYDVEGQTFYYINHLIVFQGQQYFGFGQSIPLANQVFPFYVPQQLSFELFQSLFVRYQEENVRYLHARLMFSREGVNDDLLRAMYELKLTREALPTFLGVMLKGQEEMGTAAVEWQILLSFFLVRRGVSLSYVTRETIYDFLEWANLRQTQEAQKVVHRYVQLLVKLKVEGIWSVVEKEALMKYVYDELFAIE